MSGSAERFGALLQGSAALLLVGIGGVVFVPGYDGGLGQAVVASAAGLVLGRTTLYKFDAGGRRTRTALAVIGSLGALVGATTVVATQSAGVVQLAALGSAVVGVVATAADELARRRTAHGVNVAYSQLGLTSAMAGALLLLSLPPAEDEPFRTLFLAIATFTVGYGLVVTSLAVFGVHADRYSSLTGGQSP